MTERAIVPRRVAFDWDAVPRHWINDNPHLTHTLNALHVLLPPGERWFVEVCRDALPDVEDPQLRVDVRGFMGQEAIHGRSHQSALDYMYRYDLDPDPQVEAFEQFLQRCDRISIRLAGEEKGKRMRIAAVAAIEHLTAVLSSYVWGERFMDDADPAMADLFLWHTAEEIEHRAVMFDLLREADTKRWTARFRGMVFVLPLMLTWWAVVRRSLIKNDHTLDGVDLKEYAKETRRHLGFLKLTKDALAYLKPGFHPSKHHHFPEAAEYLLTSPGVLAAKAA